MLLYKEKKILYVAKLAKYMRSPDLRAHDILFMDNNLHNLISLQFIKNIKISNKIINNIRKKY